MLRLFLLGGVTLSMFDNLGREDVGCFSRERGMLTVSQKHLSAHEQQQQDYDDAVSLQWYRRLSANVPQPADEELQDILSNAYKTASSVGIERSERERIHRLMVMIALMPTPTDGQWLLGIDTVFDEQTQESAVLQLKRIAQNLE